MDFISLPKEILLCAIENAAKKWKLDWCIMCSCRFKILVVEEREHNLICVFSQIISLILYILTFQLADEIENERPKWCIFFSVQVVIKARSQSASCYRILIAVLQNIERRFHITTFCIVSKTSKILDLCMFTPNSNRRISLLIHGVYHV